MILKNHKPGHLPANCPVVGFCENPRDRRQKTWWIPYPQLGLLVRGQLIAAW